MFLNRLEEGNKKLFLKVCTHAAWSNGVFQNEQKDMVFAYCREMNIPEHIPEYNGTIDATIEELASKATEEEKNIIVLEILGLVKSDGAYEETEKEFMDALVTGLKVKESVFDKISSLLEKYIDLCSELLSTVSEK